MPNPQSLLIALLVASPGTSNSPPSFNPELAIMVFASAVTFPSTVIPKIL